MSNLLPKGEEPPKLMRYNLSLLILLLLLGAGKSWGQCSVYPAGLTGLTVTYAGDTSVTFNWTSTAPGQSYNITVTNDSTNSNQSQFTYYFNDVTDTFASQGLLQPGTKYYIFVDDDNCFFNSDSTSFTTGAWVCGQHQLQAGIIPPADTCSSDASFGMPSTSVYQQYTFLHNGNPIGGFTNLPGSSSNPISYPVPAAQAASGAYQVITFFPQCPGDTLAGNTEYWYFAGVYNLAVNSQTGSTVHFNWATQREGSQYQWGITTDSLNVPDSLVTTTDTFAVATNLIPGTKYFIYVTNDSISACSNLFDTVSFTAANTPSCGVVQPSFLGAGPTCLAGASFGMDVTYATQNYTFLHNGKPIPGYTDLPGPGTNGISYLVPADQQQYAGSYSVITFVPGCTDTVQTNTQYGYFGGVLNLTAGPATDSSGHFYWQTAQDGSQYQWGISTSPTGPPDSLVNTTDTFATATGLMPGTTYYIYLTNLTTCAGDYDTLSFVTPPGTANPCGAGSVPAPTIRTGSGSFTLCGNGGLVLTSSSPTGNQWYANGGLVPDSTGQTFVVSQSGGYSVSVTTPQGCSATSNVQTVVIDPGPATPVITASGPVAICGGSSVTLLSSAGSDNQWYQNNNLLPGDTTDQYTAAQAGVYSVRVTDAAGCWAASNDMTVTVGASSGGSAVIPVISPVGPQIQCSDSAVLLQSSVAASYQWFDNGNPIPGAIGDSLTVMQSGSYTVATGSGGCAVAGGLSTAVQVVYLVTTVPTITAVNGVLVSNFAAGNQWYLNDSLIYGATHQDYTPQTTGSYTLRVGLGFPPLSDSVPIGVGGCYSEFSAPVTITDSTLGTPQVLVYPNPAVDELTLVNKRPTPVTIRIFDMMGRNLMTRQGMTGTVVVDVRRWGKGAYIVLMIDEGTQQQNKIMILRL